MCIVSVLGFIPDTTLHHYFLLPYPLTVSPSFPSLYNYVCVRKIELQPSSPSSQPSADPLYTNTVFLLYPHLPSLSISLSSSSCHHCTLLSFSLFSTLHIPFFSYRSAPPPASHRSSPQCSAVTAVPSWCSPVPSAGSTSWWGWCCQTSPLP